MNKVRLTDFASDTYSQFGEDGIIDHIFIQLDDPPPEIEEDEDGEPIIPEPQEPRKIPRRVCVEFGASDDPDCSNVANLWKADWSAILIEADAERAQALTSKVNGSCSVLNRRVEPTGSDSIDSLVSGVSVDFMSIDVDGNDYHIWRHMKMRPRVICVEFNPTIPPHVSIHQEYDPVFMGFGSSLKALVDLGLTKGYTFVGATQINAFFVDNDLARPFFEYERDPVNLAPMTNFTYLVTDFLGSAIAVGAQPPWGIHLPYDGPALAGNFQSITQYPKQTMDAFEAKYGSIIRWPQENMPNIADPDFTGAVPGGNLGSISARNLLRKYMDFEESPICIAVAHVSIEQVNWVYNAAALGGYHCRLGGGVLTLMRSN